LQIGENVVLHFGHSLEGFSDGLNVWAVKDNAQHGLVKFTSKVNTKTRNDSKPAKPIDDSDIPSSGAGILFDSERGKR